MLERRERDAEELDLESCFSEMRSKVAGGNMAGLDDEIESMASDSIKRGDFEPGGRGTQGSASRKIENVSASNFYKP